MRTTQTVSDPLSCAHAPSKPMKPLVSYATIRARVFSPVKVEQRPEDSGQTCQRLGAHRKAFANCAGAVYRTR